MAIIKMEPLPLPYFSFHLYFPSPFPCVDEELSNYTREPLRRGYVGEELRDSHIRNPYKNNRFY